MSIHFYQALKIIFKFTGLVFIASLLSCSGSDSGDDLTLYSVGGTVTGLQGSVTLRNNSTDLLTLSNSGSFSFNNKLNSGASYSVQIQAQPSGQICTVSNASGVVNADVTNVMVSCTTRVSLSGSYQLAPLIQVDSDINDPLAVANVDNGSFIEAQSIANFSTVHGFATLAGTGRILDGDRFAVSGDEYDTYRVNLQKNQTLRLQVSDFAGVDVFQGDLDLFLYDSGFNLVDYSYSTGEFENISVLADGDYYIVVAAYDGTSKYTLTLNIVSPLNITRQNSVDFRTGESIIKFKPNITVNNFKASHQQMVLSHHKTTRPALANFDVSDVSSASIAGSLKVHRRFIEELRQKNPGSYEKFITLQQIKRMNQRQDIEYAEPNYIYKPLLVPNDEFYSLQWHYPAINLPQAWDITTGSRIGSDVIVAVVDTGVFLSHTELSGQLLSGYDFISDITNAADGDGIDADPDDPGDSATLNSSSWHGTHVAGTVAAKTDNNDGVAGIAWQAKIMPLRVLGTLGGSNYDIIQAIRYAARLSNDSNTLPAQKADIINLSLGGSGFSQAAQDAYDEVRAAGVIIVAAAGNENTSVLSYPASYDGVISVSATDFVNARAPYSNYGGKIDVAAPGGNQLVDLNNDSYGDGVLSTLVDDSTGTRKSTLSFYQGTSMAAPHVAGVFALMRAVYPALSPDEIDSLLAAGSITTDLGTAGRDDIYGYGLLDALKAVQMAQLLENGGTLPPQPALIVATRNQLTMGATSTATLILSNEGGVTASITSVTDDASWLSVLASSVDGNNLGEYQVTIDRTGLSDSSYLGTITFNLSTGSSLQVLVSMDVGIVDKTGNAGTVYMLLLDDSNEVIDQVSAVDDGNGIFNYNFTNVVAGGYRIVAGSDIDNDLFICQLAEACGGYPTISELSTIQVTDADITGLDFVVDILANFGASSSLATESITGSSGFKRSPVPLTDGKQLSR
jgi:serine protease